MVGVFELLESLSCNDLKKRAGTCRRKGVEPTMRCTVGDLELHPSATDVAGALLVHAACISLIEKYPLILSNGSRWWSAEACRAGQLLNLAHVLVGAA